MAVRITALVPTYNASTFIEETLASVIGQQRVPDEIVVVDDGSTDDTVEMVRAWVVRHPRAPLKLIEQTNQGSSASRNTGLRAASGDWVAFLDADDIWEPGFLQAMETLLIQHPRAVAVFADGALFDHKEKTAPAQQTLLAEEKAVSYGKRLDQGEAYRLERAYQSLVEGCYIVLSALMVQRQAALDIGLFDARLRTAVDRDFLLRLSLRGEFVYCRKRQVRIRVHENNLTHPKYATLRARNVTQLLSKLLSTSGQLGLSEPERQATARELERAMQRLLYHASCQGMAAYLGSLRETRGMSHGGVRVRPRDVLRATYASVFGGRRGYKHAVDG